MIVSRETIDLEDVKTSLLSKQKLDRKLTFESSNDHGASLVARGRSIERSNSSRSRSKSKHRDLICNYCKSEGHIKINCLKLKAKQQRENNQNQQNQGNANWQNNQTTRIDRIRETKIPLKLVLLKKKTKIGYCL